MEPSVTNRRLDFSPIGHNMPRMKTVFRLPALFLWASSAGAHDSVVPHTHSFDHQHSDLFVWSLAMLVTLTGVGLVLRFLRKRRHAEPFRSKIRRS